MSRNYTLKRRAEKQAETRQRIVEAAVELHGSVGPAATTVSQVAERAGVQRKTFYAHFPDEWSLFLACSGWVLESDPMPVAAPWRALETPADRLRAGLDALYGWYERNAGLAACVLRDAEHHGPTQEIVRLRMAPPLAEAESVLGAGLNAGQRALLRLALSFHSWRTLARDCGLDRTAAVAALVRSIETAGETSGTPGR